MEPFWIWTIKALALFCVLSLAGLIVAGIMASRARGGCGDAPEDGHDPVRGSPVWFVVRLGFVSVVALACCFLAFLSYVWFVSDDVDDGVNKLIEEQRQEKGR